MASERDREIWDDATNAVCQAMQEQKMCNCPDGDCLAAKIDFSPEKIATATRPAPAATDTGLETYDARSIAMALTGTVLLPSPDGEYVPRSQAEGLLVAERAEKEKSQQANENWFKDYSDLRADNAAKDARIKELEEYFVKCTSNETFLEQDARRVRQIEALEVKLAAAEKALQEADEALQADAIASAHAAIRAVLGGEPS